MSTRKAYPAMPPHRDAKCAGCDVPYRRVTMFPGNSRVVVKHRLKMVIVAGVRARLCDKCRKLHRRFGTTNEHPDGVRALPPTPEQP